MTNGIKLPPVNIGATKPKLPYSGNAITEKSFAFSFACFDRSHKLFNLSDEAPDGVVSGKWFLDMLDCLKTVSNKKISELKGTMYDPHPIDWSKTNTSAPNGFEHLEYWQFRINKSRGRVIGFKIDNVFYIVWFDPHHNLTDSDGYGTATKYRAPESEYETNQRELEDLRGQVIYLVEELKTAEELIEQFNVKQ